MIEIKGSPKERQVREWLNENMNGEIPVNVKIIDVFKTFQNDLPGISYGCLNSTIKKAVAEGNGVIPNPTQGNSVVINKQDQGPLVANVVNIADLEFPDFKLHRTGKKIDALMSDHEENGGLYGGTVNIVVGESGVGKSTVLLSMMADIKAQDPSCRMLYVSSEMTRNDLLFYYKKTPAIANVPTILLMDYVKTGTLDRILLQIFNDEYDIIVLDSHQDVIVKLKEVHGWKATFAESWLTNMMIDAAETNGTAVLAIQHMTKGGQYVGSTYLKHATTAMLEMFFDDAGLRYLTFSKNRRGGSQTGKRLYFYLDKNTGDVLYDGERFDETEELSDIENTEAIRQQDLSKTFDDIFIKRKGGDSVVNESEEESVDFPDQEETDKFMHTATLEFNQRNRS